MSRARWRNVYIRHDGRLVSIDVLPIADTRAHQEGASCWCEPKAELVGVTTMRIHRAADARELVERHGVN